MIRQNIIDLKPGMVLAQSVRNLQGVLLLEAGAKITKKNIRIFKSWGVTEVSVEGKMNDSRTASDTPVAAVQDTFKRNLEAKFSDVLDNPVMVDILNAASKLLLKDLPKIENE